MSLVKVFPWLCFFFATLEGDWAKAMLLVGERKTNKNKFTFKW